MRLKLSGLTAAAFATAVVAQPQPAATYIDPARCQPCHAEIAKHYRDTGMGRSFYRPGPNTPVSAAPYYHEKSDSYFATLVRDGKYYQRRWQKTPNGAETNVDEKQIDFIVGSGNHVLTYLHLTARNTLQQLPLSWYAEKGGSWAMSPGYDRPDYPGSTRVVTYECMFCHNAYPKIPSGHDEAGADPQFLQPLPEGIDCQRCHGPGSRHVAAATRPGANPAEVRAAIVNPKSGLEVCMQCHLETTTAALPHDLRRFDRAPFAYAPGQPLGDFRITFDRGGGMGNRFELAQGAYRMRESQCFLKSNGKFTCTTCHDPHNVTHGEAATARYNRVCRTCHGASFEKAVLAKSHTSAPDCVGCHMPKRRTEDAVHVVMTDHFIRRQMARPGALAELPELPEPPYRGDVVAYYPASFPAADAGARLLIALAQVVEWSNLQKGLPQFQALLEQVRPTGAEYYAGLADALNHTGDRARAMPWFEEAARRAPTSPVILRKLGSAQMESGQLLPAEATLLRVTKLAPDDAAAWTMLGQVLSRENKRADAKAAFSRAAESDPELPELHAAWATQLAAEGDITGAIQAFREEVRIQTGNARARANLASLLASRGEFPEAQYHFEQAIRTKPDFADARLNYARMLAALNRTTESEQQARAALAADPGMALAHLLLGALLAARNDDDGAQRELETALRLHSDLWRAHYELAVVLLKKGDRAAAVIHLLTAAKGADPEAKTLAQQLLDKLR